MPAGGPKATLAPDEPAPTSLPRVAELLDRVLALTPQGSPDRARAQKVADALRKVASTVA